jgi:hypothetical protein
MTSIDITLNRAFRVWWSYAWRKLLLSLFLIVPLQILVITWIVPQVRAAGGAHALGGAPLHALLERVWLVCPFVIAGAILIETSAMRWMLRRARWAEFELLPSVRPSRPMP